MEQRKITKVVLFIVILQVSSSCVNAKFFNTRPCKDTSSYCLAKHIQAALPAFTKGSDEYGLGSLDPYVMDNFQVLLAGGLRIQLKQGKARGMRKCVVDYARMVDDTIETQVRCNITFRGKYKSSGHLLMFSFNGDGDALVKCTNLKVHNVMTLGTREDHSGRKYFVMKSTTSDYSYDGRLTYSLTNLLKGNPEAGKVILQFMNDNWRLIAEEFGGPFIDVGINQFTANLERLFNVIPQDQFVIADF